MYTEETIPQRGRPRPYLPGPAEVLRQIRDAGIRVRLIGGDCLKFDQELPLPLRIHVIRLRPHLIDHLCEEASR